MILESGRVFVLGALMSRIRLIYALEGLKWLPKWLIYFITPSNKDCFIAGVLLYHV